MRIDKSATSGSCDVIEAEFRYGPVRCLRQTDLTTEDDGETFFICEEHATAACAEMPS